MTPPHIVDRLVRENLRLVMKIANQIKSRIYGFDDLVAIGNEGLFHAARHYDPARCPRFSPYAGQVIRGFMFNAIRSEYGGVTTMAARKLFFALRRADLYGVNDVEVISQHTGIDVETVSRLLPHLRQGHVRLDAPDRLFEHETVADRIASDDSLPVRLEDAEAKRKIRSAIWRLPRRLRAIIERRYLRDEQELLDTIGADWGLSRERVRQLEVRAIKELKVMLKAA